MADRVMYRCSQQRESSTYNPLPRNHLRLRWTSWGYFCPQSEVPKIVPLLRSHDHASGSCISWSRFMMFATFCGHMAFYNVFVKNWHLFLFLFFGQNHAHSEPLIRLTTPDSLNDHCKKNHKIWSVT